MEPLFSIPMSRRSFMKLAGVAVTGAVLGGAIPKAEAEAAQSSMTKVDFGAAELPVLFAADVCVVGGGSAGTAAAVMAGRRGAKTVLVERSIALGGLSTQGCVYPCMPTFAYGSDTPYITDLNKRMEGQGIAPLLGVETETFYGGGAGQYTPDYLSYVYDEMCAEAGVDILYNAALVGAVTEGGRIVSCVVQTVEGLGLILAKVFIDATGDALLSRFAGAPVERGSEKTGRNQPMSLRFEMSGIDVQRAHRFFKEEFHDNWSLEKPSYFFEFAKWKKTEAFFKAGVRRGELTEDDILYIQAFTVIGKPGTMSMNCPELPPLSFSATDARSLSKSVSFGMKMQRRLAGFFVKNIPGFEKAQITRTATQVGVRESWRVKGKYYLTAQDYFEGRHFPGAICRTAYPIDIHDVDGGMSKKLKKGDYYEIPYDALVTKELSNLMVAGRCASGSFSAQASFRIQPTCMSMGEAAGIAAAWGLQHGVEVNALRWEDIPKEQRSYVSESGQAS